MQHAAQSGGESGDGSPYERLASPRDCAVVGEGFGKSHTDARADRSGKPNKKCLVGFARKPCRREKRRECGNRSIHKAKQSRLDDLQNELRIVVATIFGRGPKRLVE